MLSHSFIISFPKMPLLQNLQINYNYSHHKNLPVTIAGNVPSQGFSMRAARRKDVFCQVKLKANQHPSELNRSEPGGGVYSNDRQLMWSSPRTRRKLSIGSIE